MSCLHGNYTTELVLGEPVSYSAGKGCTEELENTTWASDEPPLLMGESVGKKASTMVGLIHEKTDLACPTGNHLLGKTGPVPVEERVCCGVDAASTVGLA